MRELNIKITDECTGNCYLKRADHKTEPDQFLDNFPKKGNKMRKNAKKQAKKGNHRKFRTNLDNKNTCA